MLCEDDDEKVMKTSSLGEISHIFVHSREMYNT